MFKRFFCVTLAAFIALTLTGAPTEEKLTIENKECPYITVTQYETPEDLHAFFYRDETPDPSEEETLTPFLNSLLETHRFVIISIENKKDKRMRYVDSLKFFPALYTHIMGEEIQRSHSTINQSTKWGHTQIQEFLGDFPRRTLQQLCYHLCCQLPFLEYVYLMPGFARLYELDRELLIQEVNNEHYWPKEIFIHPGHDQKLYFFFKRKTE